MEGTMADALNRVGVTVEDNKYYGSYKDIPLQMFSIPIRGILKARSREGLMFSTGLRDEVLNCVNDIVTENKGQYGVSEEFIRGLPILESEKNNIEIRNFLIKHKERVVLCNGYGVAISYDRRNLGFCFLQNNHKDLCRKVEASDMLAWLENGIKLQSIPFICLKINDSIVIRKEVNRSNYLFTAYGCNILKDKRCEEHLHDWYAKFGKKNVRRETLYHVCMCNSHKYANQWYLVKAKEEEHE